LINFVESIAFQRRGYLLEATIFEIIRRIKVGVQEGGKTFEDDIVDSLEQCLSDLGIMHCLPTLKEWGIDSVEDLAELNDDDITELELKKIQHRKFIKFIASLKS